MHHAITAVFLPFQMCSPKRKKKGRLHHRGQYGYLGRDVGDDLFFFFLEITPEYGVILTAKYGYATTRL